MAPQGEHSDNLARVLNYFRRTKLIDKYAIKRHKRDPSKNRENEVFSIIAISGETGSPPRVVDQKEYQSLGEAFHAVFLLRVNDLLES